MKNRSNQEIYEEIIVPVLGNVVNVYQALSVFNAVSQKAGEINKSKFKSFFNYTHRLSLEYAVLSLCKLYDKSKRYPKHTVYSLCTKIEKDVPDHSFPTLERDILENLEFSKTVISTLSSPSSRPSVRKRQFLNALRQSDWISSEKNKTLEICFAFRDKKIAHLEDLRLSKVELPDYYPSSEQVKWCADRVYDTCCLTMDIYGVPRLLLPTWAKTIRGNALGVIREALNIDFKSLEEMTQFYHANNDE